MQSSQIPARFSQAFAANAGGVYKRTIPQASQIGITPGAASLNDGFPPLTFTPLASGGVAPSGADFNGILNAITLWVQWLNAGAPVFYDATFSTAIGGYPKAALIAADTGTYWYLSTVENNTTNPNTGGAGWIQVVPASPATAAPNMDGTAAVGSSLLFARADHTHPTDTSRAALSYVNATFETIAHAATTYLTQNNPGSNGTFIHNGTFDLNGDAWFMRGGAANQGIVFLGNSGVRYLQYDGANYIMPGAELYVNSQPVVSRIQTAQSTADSAVAALPGKAGKITGSVTDSYFPDINLRIKTGAATLVSAAGAAMYSGIISFATAFPTACTGFSFSLISGDTIFDDYYATLMINTPSSSGFVWKLRKLTSSGSWGIQYTATGY